MVNKNTTRLEALLKVIVTPAVRPMLWQSNKTLTLCTQDPAEGFIMNYTLLIGDASFSNFQKVGQHGSRLLRSSHPS